VVLAWLLLSTLTLAPYLRAWLYPPPGTSFLGFFYYVDDQYNYLSYVEQAERGHFLFENKLVLEPHAPALVNLEWWVVGRASRLLGGHPLLAYRLLGLVAALALLGGIDRWLCAGGLPAANRLPALLLVGLGGGFGGLAWRLGLYPIYDAADLSMGLFPFVELLANPHFVTGTALLTWALYFLSIRGRSTAGIVVGTGAALVRPYDVVLLGLARVTAVIADAPVREWVPRLLPLAALLPSLAYLGWVFYLLPSFRSFGLTYVFPPGGALALALVPSATLALSCLGAHRTPRALSAQLHLAGWAIGALALGLLRPVGFSLQLLVGVGVPLLILAALGLARAPRAMTLLATAALCTTPAIALGLVLGRNPRWFVSTSDLELAGILRTRCVEGDVLFAPEAIGLYANGLTPCKAVLALREAPTYAANAALVSHFYGEASPAERSALLDRLRVNRLVLPGDAGPSPWAWLGSDSPFERTETVGTFWSLYARPPSR
jgi:hypothetical protein